MTRDQFLQFVREYIEDDPEAAAQVADYVQAGVGELMNAWLRANVQAECERMKDELRDDAVEVFSSGSGDDSEENPSYWCAQCQSYHPDTTPHIDDVAEPCDR